MKLFQNLSMWNATNFASQAELEAAGFDHEKSDYNFYTMIKHLNNSGGFKASHSEGFTLPW